MGPLATPPVTQLSAAIISLDVMTCSLASAQAIAQRQQQGLPVTLLPLALSTLLEDEAGVFDFQLLALGPSHWRPTLGHDEDPAPARRERCRHLLAGFARQQGAVAPHIETRLAEAIPAGRSGKRQRIVAALARR